MSHAALPPDIASYKKRARACLQPDIWEYLDDSGYSANAQVLRQCSLMPRPLADVRDGHTRLQLFGQHLDHPVLLAPVAYQRLFHPDGESASAMAAAAQRGQSVISSLASQPLQTITQAAAQGQLAPGAPTPWFQLYWQGSRERTGRLLQRALQAGCSAVVFTVDAPVKRATLQLPPAVQAVNLEAPEPLPAGTDQVFGGWMAQAPNWDDLAWLRRQTSLPLLLKGVLHPADALAALDAGCDGLVVSNHGGRVMEGAAPSLSALPGVVDGVGGRVPVLLDSGLRDGRDVFVALAHGASAVLLGRPFVWALAAHGALGVAHVLRLVRDELEMTMAQTGCRELADIGPHCLGPPLY